MIAEQRLLTLAWAMSVSPARTTSESLVASSGPARVSILAVDDQPANLVAIESIVDPLGHDLVAVESGLAALNAVSTREFAAIVLDVNMPGLDGFELFVGVGTANMAFRWGARSSTAHGYVRRA